MYKYDICKKNRQDLKNLGEKDELQSKVKQVSFVEKVGKQGYHYDIKEIIWTEYKSITRKKSKIT